MSIESFDMATTTVGNPQMARDVESVRDLWLTVGGERGVIDTELARQIMEGLDYFVKRDEDTGRIIGALSLLWCGKDLVKIDSVAVDPAFRGNGYATKLTQHALAHAFDTGATTAVANALPAYQGVLERLGFETQEVYDTGNATMYLDK